MKPTSSAFFLGNLDISKLVSQHLFEIFRPLCDPRDQGRTRCTQAQKGGTPEFVAGFCCSGAHPKCALPWSSRAHGGARRGIAHEESGNFLVVPNSISLQQTLNHLPIENSLENYLGNEFIWGPPKKKLTLFSIIFKP